MGLKDVYQPLIESALEEIKTSLSNKGVECETLKISEIPDKIREIPISKEPMLAGDRSSLYSGVTKSKLKKIIFTDKKATQDTTPWGDNGVVKWLDGDTLYVSTQTPGSKIKFPANCDSMFYDTDSLEFLELNNVDTSGVTNMYDMFYNCGTDGLIITGLDNFNTENVTNMQFMFQDCKVKTLDVSSFNTTNVTEIWGMFQENPSLESIKFGDFNLPKTQDLECLFRNTGLTSLDLTSFNIDNATNIYAMFADNQYLTELDLSTFNVSNITNVRDMFENCPNLTTIYATEWANELSPSIESEIDSKGKGPFNGCTTLGASDTDTIKEKGKWKENGGYFTNPAQKPK